MTSVVAVGVAVLDFVFFLDELPRTPEKTRARDAVAVGGGCAANAAVAVARLGGDAHLAANVGQDEIGRLIVGDLQAEGVDCSAVRHHRDSRSSFSSVYVDAAGERQIVNFRDEGLYHDASWLAAALPEQFDAVLADTRWPAGAREAMAAAREKARPGVLDADLIDQDTTAAFAAASHIAFSASGLRRYTGCDGLEDGLRAMRGGSDAWLCVTDGARGVTFLDGTATRHVAAFPVKAVDTLGAGDVWHGAFALALGEGRAESEAIVFANAVAALKCTRPGGRKGIPDRAETEAFMRQAR